MNVADRACLFVLTLALVTHAREPPEATLALVTHAREHLRLMGKTLVSPEDLAGTFYGNGCACSPECCRLEVSPACCGGICVLQYCSGCPIPFTCQYMIPCCGARVEYERSPCQRAI